MHQSFEGPCKIYKNGKLNILSHVKVIEVSLHPAPNVAQFVVIMNRVTKTSRKLPTLVHVCSLILLSLDVD